MLVFSKFADVQYVPIFYVLGKTLRSYNSHHPAPQVRSRVNLLVPFPQDPAGLRDAVKSHHRNNAESSQQMCIFQLCTRSRFTFCSYICKDCRFFLGFLNLPTSQSPISRTTLERCTTKCCFCWKRLLYRARRCESSYRFSVSKCIPAVCFGSRRLFDAYVFFKQWQ